MVCWYDPNGITTVYENIGMWQRLSDFELEILNLWPSRGHPLVLPATLALSEFDGIIIHAAVAYNFENLKALDSQLDRPFEHYDGLKVLMKQDEQRTTARFAEYLGRKKFNVLLTCVPATEVPRVYSRDVVGNVAFVHVLTGYVSQAMREMAELWSGSRPIDIGYRGSTQPLCFGRLGFEKRKIGYDVASALAGREAMRNNISSRPQDRFNGPAWMDFIAASKATLGVESGSNLFDFDGDVEEWCGRFEAAHPEIDPLSEQLYTMAHQEHLWRFEGNVDYAQVSPRHFEAAAARSLQILYEGRYSDIFLPGEHFLPLARDLSNLEEIVETLHDERKCTEITERCFAEIIHNPNFSYEAFVAKVDAALDPVLRQKSDAQRRPSDPAGGSSICLVLTALDPAQAQRVGQIASSLAPDYEAYEIGTYGSEVDGGCPRLEQLSASRFRLRIEPTRHGSWWLPEPVSSGSARSAALHKLLYLAVLVEASEPQLRAAIGALDALPEDIAAFRKQARSVLNCSSALFEAAQRTGRFDLVVATDLGSLPAAMALRDEAGARVLFDSGESFPDKAPGARHWQNEFWINFSRDLVADADLAITASEQSALLMTAEFGRKFEVLPTLERISQLVLDAGTSKVFGNDPAKVDFSWLDDPNAMRSRSPAEAETSRLLNSYAANIVRLRDANPVQAELETARVLNLYAAEIIRLNEYFPTEIDRLNEVYQAEIARLQTDSAQLRAEIERLHSVYKAEIAKLREIIESYWGVRLYRLCRRGGARALRTFRKAESTGS